MKLSKDKHEKYTTVKLLDTVMDNSIVPQLKSELMLINSEGIRNIIVDLAAVTEADSSGLACLLTGQRLCEQAKGSFVVCNANKQVRELVKISKLEDTLTIVSSEEEAVDIIFMEEIERDLKEELN